MASLEELSVALKNAHEAGDSAAAQKIAQAIQRQRMNVGLTLPQQDVPRETPQGGTIADSLGQSLFTFGDEIAGGLGATANTIAGLFGGGTGESFGEAYRGIRDIAREREQAFATRNPKTAFVAELAGGLLTGGAGALRAGAVRGGETLARHVPSLARGAATATPSLGRLAGVGAAEGALFGAGASEADLTQGDIGGLLSDVGSGAALGGALGGGVPAVTRSIGGLLSGAGRTGGDVADEVYQSAVRQLDEAGVSLTTGQKVGSRGLKTTESTLSGTLGGGRITKTLEKQQQQLQSKLFRLAGFADDDIASGVLTRDALDRASTRFGRRYDDALKGKKVNIGGDEFIDDLANVERQHSQLLGFEQRKQIRDIINDVLDRATEGPLSGREYQRLRSLLGKRQRQMMNRDATIADLYGGIKNALDDAFERASGATRQLNREYAHFRQLDDAFTRSAGARRGQLPLASLGNAAERLPGSREWKDLLRAANLVLSDAVGNSGTTTRQLGTTVGGLVQSPLHMAIAAPLARGTGAGAIRAGQTGIGAIGRGLQQLEPLGLLATPGAASGLLQ